MNRVGSLPATAEAKRLFALEKLAAAVFIYRTVMNAPSRGMGAKVYWARDEVFKALDEVEKT